MRSSMRLVLAALPWWIACSYASLVSEVKHATVECESCAAGGAVAVGVPIKVKLDWKKCPKLDRKCDPNTPPFTVGATCDGAPCSAEDLGGGYLEVTPVEPGTATIVIRIADKKQREFRLGPITAVAMTGIDMTCTFLPPGGEVRVPCELGIKPGSDVHLEMIARAGDRRLVNPLPHEVAVDGKLVFAEGRAIGSGTWECKASSDSSDPAIPTVRKCVRRNVALGATWTVEARLPAQNLAASVRIKVGK